MYFIMLTAALTLHQAGITEVTNASEAAIALQPIAGRLAGALYTIGVLGVGLLTIPALTCAAAYALSEVFKWHEGLDWHLRGAPGFYAVVVGGTVTAVVLNFVGIQPMQALFLSGVLNGALAPFLLVAVVSAVGDRKLMAGQPMRPFGRLIVLLATLLMLGTLAGMLVPMVLR
jgi:Mn2+/Fe2+ NRAMP family transporter